MFFSGKKKSSTTKFFLPPFNATFQCGGYGVLKKKFKFFFDPEKVNKTGFKTSDLLSVSHSCWSCWTTHSQCVNLRFCSSVVSDKKLCLRPWRGELTICLSRYFEQGGWTRLSLNSWVTCHQGFGLIMSKWVSWSNLDLHTMFYLGT